MLTREKIKNALKDKLEQRGTKLAEVTMDQVVDSVEEYNTETAIETMHNTPLQFWTPPVETERKAKEIALDAVTRIFVSRPNYEIKWNNDGSKNYFIRSCDEIYQWLIKEDKQ